MQGEKKLINMLNNFADWLLRIIIVNFLVITTMIPIITIIPALCAGYKVFADALNKDEVPTFKAFFKYFKEDFVNKLIISVVLVILLAVSIYNLRSYGKLIEDNPKIMYSIGYYIVLTIVVAVIMIALYLPFVFSQRRGYEIKDILKLSFYLAGKYFLRTILVFLTLLIPYLMATTQLLLLLTVFFGISIPLLLNAIIMKKPRMFLEDMEEKI